LFEKKALPRAYARVPEFYRKKFRTLVRGKWESYSNFAFRLNASMKSWLDGEQAQEDIEHYEQLNNSVN